ncbi:MULTISPECIES: EamA family transporter [Haloferax]|uniref:EamA family transporter n=1 Tax=Haloferax marinum TaxID=2666143 RepID=A0A6A8GC52_9EURY|nr:MULTISPECIES: EamA family transporter [Haloferax]KAB1191245.1 EamA family transporter [Haloferax sp. CBA1150]MRW98138.1 EamA family transporter [Haloferax marinum]
MFSNYIAFALVAMVSWGLWAILATYALDYAKAAPVVLLTYAAGLAIVLVVRHDTASSVHSVWGIVFGLAGGLAMGIGTLAFYRSLSMGGGSVTAAIAGLYFLVTTVYDLVVVGNPAKPTKIGGLLLAVGAIVLLAQ